MVCTEYSGPLLSHIDRFTANPPTLYIAPMPRLSADYSQLHSDTVILIVPETINLRIGLYLPPCLTKGCICTTDSTKLVLASKLTCYLYFPLTEYKRVKLCVRYEP